MEIFSSIFGNCLFLVSINTYFVKVILRIYFVKFLVGREDNNIYFYYIYGVFLKIFILIFLIF